VVPLPPTTTAEPRCAEVAEVETGRPGLRPKEQPRPTDSIDLLAPLYLGKRPDPRIGRGREGWARAGRLGVTTYAGAWKCASDLRGSGTWHRTWRRSGREAAGTRAVRASESRRRARDAAEGARPTPPGESQTSPVSPGRGSVLPRARRGRAAEEGQWKQSSSSLRRRTGPSTSAT
jgi:hypothetical protein